jgi:hypothetical protein
MTTGLDHFSCHVHVFSRFPRSLDLFLPLRLPSFCLQVVPLLMRAVGWHGASVLALETLKRLVTANNRARDALVGQGLRWGAQDTKVSIFDTRIPKTRYFRVSAGAVFRQSCSVLLSAVLFVIPFPVNLAGISLDVWTTVCRNGFKSGA